MDVRDLAPALMGIGGVFSAANAILNHNQEHVSVQVTSTKHGSFGIDFDIIHTTNQIVSLLNSGAVTASVNAAGLIGIVWGVIEFLKWLKGNKPEKIEPQGQNITVHLHQQTIQVSLEIFKLFQDLELRNAIAKTIAEPLQREGIESLHIESPKQPTISIKKAEAHWFEVKQQDEETLVDITTTKAFTMVAISFKEENKWRLYDGISIISVSITDTEFLQRIDQGQPFSKNDILVCDVRTIQKRTSEGLKTEYIVLKVKEHKPAARQLAFSIEE
ncbi:MAG: hypothetical protein EBQ80_04835 [Proteobacteria bacterium]|nr:hypothetical protein [Pseudomonadota bacterium]